MPHPSSSRPTVFRRTTLALTTLLFIASMLATQSAFAQITLRLAHVASDTNPIAQAGQRFADNLAKISAGQMTVQIHGRGSLGGISALWTQLMAGALDLHVIDIGAMSVLKQARPLMVMWTPFLFRNQDHLRKYVESDVFATQMNDIEAKTSIHFLGLVGDRSPRVVSTTGKAVRTVDDMKGLKIRVPGNPIFVKTFEAWGSIATPIKPGEMFSALKSGMVDGQDNGVVSIANSALGKVIRHVTPINWAHSGVGLWISQQRWQQLSDKEKGWVRQAARQSGEQGKAVGKQQLVDANGKLSEMGITITQPELDGFQSVTDKVVNDLEGKMWPAGMVDKIRGIR